MHRTLRRAAVWAAALAALVVALPPSSHGEEEWPGLPETDGTFGQSWAGAAQGGISYASRAKQWFRSPDGMVTFRAALGKREWEDASGRPISGSGECATTCTNRYKAGGQAFIVSPEGAPAPYGYLAPMTVRSVGFGLMPVEATVQISQRRKDGYPVPFETWLPAFDTWERRADASQGGQYVTMKVAQTGEPTRFEDAVDVRILKVLVDGVDLGLTGECRTVSPAPMDLGSPKYTIDLTQTTAEEWFARADPSEFFHPERGGQLSGTITIPPFTGCTTASGDDLSDLMTLSVSGPDNPVTARIGWTCVALDDGGQLLGRPLQPGEDTPKRTLETTRSYFEGDVFEAGCYGTKKLPYPERPAD